MRESVVIIGAGRSGRGMLGELYYKDKARITFADKDAGLTAGLRKQGYYTVKMSNMSSGESRETRVEGFQVLNTMTEHEAYIRSMCQADFISTALMPDAFDQVIGDLAEMIRMRMAAGNEKMLFITLGANYVGLYEYYDSGLRARLNPEERAYFDRCIRLVMSIVNRKNLLPPEQERTEDAYRVIGDDKPVLRVEDSEELRVCPNMPSFFRLEKNLSAAMVVKIWTGNLVQCSMAFVALAHGLTRSCEAAYHPVASRYAYYAAAEGYNGVAREYGLPSRTAEQAREPVAVFRTRNVDDSLFRIVREPIRKLGRNDRLIGPALCAAKQGILPYYICRSCAYAYLYQNEEDPQSVALQRLLGQKGIYAAVREVSQLDPEVAEEKLVLELIVNSYYDISGQDPLREDN